MQRVRFGGEKSSLIASAIATGVAPLEAWRFWVAGASLGPH